MGQLVDIPIEHDDATVLMEEAVVFLACDHAAAARDDKSAASGNIGEDLGLLLAERIFAAFKDKICAGSADHLLKSVVEVDMLSTCDLRQALANARLSGSGHSNEGDVLLGERQGLGDFHDAVA